MEIVARFLAVAGVVVVVVASVLSSRYPSHGTGVTGGMTIGVAGALTAWSVICLLRQRALRKRSIDRADFVAIAAFLVMLLLTLLLFLFLPAFLHEVSLASGR